MRSPFDSGLNLNFDLHLISIHASHTIDLMKLDYMLECTSTRTVSMPARSPSADATQASVARCGCGRELGVGARPVVEISRSRAASQPATKRTGMPGPKGASRRGNDQRLPAVSLSWAKAVVAAATIAVAILVRALPRPPTPGQCQRLDASTLTAQRFNELVRARQPAVLVGAGDLPELRTAGRRWGQRDYLIRAHGDVGLQVSLSASEEFEGVELAAGWPGAQRFWGAWRRGEGGSSAGTLVEALSAAGSRYQHCSSPSSQCVRHIFDRVVVRPAVANTTLQDVLTHRCRTAPRPDTSSTRAFPLLCVLTYGCPHSLARSSRNLLGCGSGVARHVRSFTTTRTRICC